MERHRTLGWLSLFYVTQIGRGPPLGGLSAACSSCLHSLYLSVHLSRRSRKGQPNASKCHMLLQHKDSLPSNGVSDMAYQRHYLD